MRFDDLLGTVRGIDLDAPAGASAAWRQIVDLVGRARVPADAATMAMLSDLRDRVPEAARAASGRALVGANPPLPLVTLFATDAIGVATPLLRSAALADDDWLALLPTLGPRARAVLRHRRDLTPPVVRALESFGAVDFVIASDVEPDAPAEAGPAAAISAPAAESDAHAAEIPSPADPGPFVSLGSVAMGLPLVAEALRRENDNEAPPAPAGAFRIADVVARLEAFQKRQDEAPAGAMPPRPAARPDGFRFESDHTGAIRWVDGVPRGAVVGISLAQPARPTGPGVDGAAAGAFRKRGRIDGANLVVSGDDPAGGRWLISAEPAFDAATGRFTGYRGSARRPAGHRPSAQPAPRADSLRQLAHELRTPAGAIAGFSEMIEHAVLGPVSDPYRDQAAAMRADAGRLLAAIDDLDAAARIDAGALQIHPEPIALAPILVEAVRDLADVAAERGVTVSLRAGNVVAMADARSLGRLVARLIGAMVGAAGMGETIAVATLDGGAERAAFSVTRPAALASYPGEAVLTIDDEDSPASLLGLGFAIRLVRNLALALGGSLTIGERTMILDLPSALDAVVDDARRS